jgi:hypothetical protein
MIERTLTNMTKRMRSKPYRAAAAITLAALVAVTATADADTLVLTTVDDNTLIEAPNGAFSHGASYNFYAGRVGPNAEGTKRRGAIRFDFSAIPAGSTIQSVTLELYCSNAGLTTAFPVALKRMTASWGEGASFAFGGGGGSSEPGDATWLHRFYPNVLWATPGGQFVATVSATRNVSTPGWYTWASTAQLVADVQGWVDNPANNFGWLVQGNETTLKSVKRFDTHESPSNTKPKLTVVYAVPAPLLGDLNGDDIVDAADLAILLGAWGGAGAADLDASGAVDAADLALLLGAWTA